MRTSNTNRKRTVRFWVGWAIGLVLIAQVGTWLILGRQQLPETMLLRAAQRINPDYPAPTRTAVLSGRVAEVLGRSEVELGHLFKGYKEVLLEDHARSIGILDDFACRGCDLLDYSVVLNTPLVGYLEFSTWSEGLSSAGWTQRVWWFFGQWYEGAITDGWVS